MSSVNKVILIGNLGKDPELFGEGNTCGLSIATNEAWTDEEGQKQERVTWHRVVCFGKLAANCAKFLSSGRSVYVEGRLQSRKYETDAGETKYVTEIVALNVQFLSGGKSEETRAPALPAMPEKNGKTPQKVKPKRGADEEIPF